MTQPSTPLESLRDELDADRLGIACQDEGVDLFLKLHAVLYHWNPDAICSDAEYRARSEAVEVIARIRKAAKREVAA